MRRERHNFFLCWLFHLTPTTCSPRRKLLVWPRQTPKINFLCPSPNLYSIYFKFQNPQPIASGHEVIHVPGPISYLGFLLWHLWLLHSPCMHVNTCTQCVHLKKDICLLVALPQWRDYSRQFWLIQARRGPKTSFVPPIVGINKLPQKPAYLPSAPKIDSITLPIFTTSQTWKPAPKVLATDMQKYMRILQTNHWCLKFQILDWNPNLITIR